MNIMRRVLANPQKGLTKTSQIPQKHSNLQKPFCSFTSINNTNNSLLQRLLKEPTVHTKAILDSEQNNTLKRLDFKWHTLVTALNSCSNSKALQALEWRLENILSEKQRDEDHYSELILLCGETRNLSLAMRVFMGMESIGVKPTTDVFNSLISASALVGDHMTALSLFEIMERSDEYSPNSKTYNAFISMYAKFGNAKAMQAWASAKRAAGFSADLQSYESLISGCVKMKSFDSAERYFEEMMTAGILPSVHILERMVDGICDQRKFGRAKEFLQYMLGNGWAVSAYVAQRLVKLYSDLGKIEDSEELLETLIASNQIQDVLSRVHCGIISIHAKADRLDDMEYSVGRMLRQGILFKSPEDVNVVIYSYFRRAAYDRLELFLNHISSSYQFTKATYDLLVDGYRKAGLSDRLDTLLKDSGLRRIS